MSSVSNLRLLIDTHIFVWMTSDRSRISRQLQERLDDPENEVFFSAVCSWEIATKRAKGKLYFGGSPLEVAKKIGLTSIAITGEHCEAAAELPQHHRDPFDRLMVAQALVEGLILVTHDPVITRYSIPVMRNI